MGTAAVAASGQMILATVPLRIPTSAGGPASGEVQRNSSRLI